MTARLFSKTGETRGSEVEVDGEAVIGRDRKSDLVIDRPLMSGQHARLFFDEDDGRYVLEDLDSLNGTELDGDRISSPERLGHLHVITFAGSYDFFFQDLERCAQRHPGERPAPAEEPAPPEPPAAPRPAEGAAESQEITAIESDPVALPGFLARRADALSEQAGADVPEPPQDVTAIERDPVALPGSLARRADEARAEETTEEPPAAPPEAAPAASPVERTIREKLPVALPSFLAQRADAAADAVEAHETVDLAEIEDLIASDEIDQGGGLDGETADLQLVVTEPGGTLRHYPLAAGENQVGRGGGVQVSLRYPDLSRRHAVLTVGDEIRLRDLGSRNQTFVDDQALEPEADVEIQPGTRIRFGSVEARLIKMGDD